MAKIDIKPPEWAQKSLSSILYYLFSTELWNQKL